MDIFMFIGSVIISWILIYVGTKLLNDKINYKSYKFWIIYILLIFYMIISYMTTSNFVRVILNFIVMSFVFVKLYKIPFTKGILTAFIDSCYVFISEIIFVLIVTIIFKLNMQDIQKLYFGQVFSNFFIALIMYFLVHVEFLNKISNNLISNFDKASKKIIIIFTALSLTTLALLLYYVYFDINLVSSLVLSVILIVIFVAITLGLFREKINNYNLKSDYDIIISNLSHYEKMYALQRIKNHEYKNDLSILRGMIDKENKKAIDYINQLMNIKVNKNNSWMEILKKIPEGGLQGILYYKLLQMDDLNVNVDFSTSSTYNPSSYIRLSDKVKSEICKLLGIYLDNAIQAVSNINEKNIFLNIDEDKEYIIFKIANNFKGDIDLDRIYESGYTTKEKGHGFGLAIAKEILDRDSLIDNKTQIIKDKFIQEIKIKKCVET